MPIAPLSLHENYWEDLTITDEDLEFLYNHLLEIETPLTPLELAQVLVAERIRQERANLEQQQKEGGPVFLPKNHYQPGQQVTFPLFDWQSGEVVTVRPGINPEFEPFEVVAVRFTSGETREFASGLAEHKLNEPILVDFDNPALNLNHVMKTYGKAVAHRITAEFEANEDLVRIAGRWFPRALLVDVNIGYLNLTEAVLEMEGGGPLPSSKILEQIELPTDVNPKLTEFSLNLALQEDERFDEVGPSGEVLWYLHRLEPQEVREAPVYLRYRPVDIRPGELGEALQGFESLVADELIESDQPIDPANELTISLIYPHLRAGTIPLTPQIAQLVPTAYEAPRVQFTFVDGSNGQRFSGWVVRPHQYIFGLREWYLENNLIPGSQITIRRSDNPGEVIIQAKTKRSTKDWIRTVLVGADNGVVFAMLKQQISTHLDDRMAVAIADPEALDLVWEQRQRAPLEQTVFSIMRELTKLSPQGQVHAQELYAAVNIVRRTPPAPVLYYLVQNPKADHLGDLYFRLEDNNQEGENL
ncbi:MAG TPA: hypothetical protein VFF68_12865 [Anaerolineaceae bacterium]|nr:hypothetical protein [Anaerolineaceae bacterium]